MSEATMFLPVIEAYDRWSSFYDDYDNPMVFGSRQAVQTTGCACDGAMS
ncbi:MAG: hypothetical protein J2P53_06370 [Bradyrhizobiaceae bacterium]|nr:hypothetical protein [Bradyrhizobiaceae bacterium]